MKLGRRSRGLLWFFLGALILVGGRDSAAAEATDWGRYDDELMRFVALSDQRVPLRSLPEADRRFVESFGKHLVDLAGKADPVATRALDLLLVVRAEPYRSSELGRIQGITYPSLLFGDSERLFDSLYRIAADHAGEIRSPALRELAYAFVHTFPKDRLTAGHDETVWRYFEKDIAAFSRTHRTGWAAEELFDRSLDRFILSRRPFTGPEVDRFRSLARELPAVLERYHRISRNPSFDPFPQRTLVEKAMGAYASAPTAQLAQDALQTALDGLERSLALAKSSQDAGLQYAMKAILGTLFDYAASPGPRNNYGPDYVVERLEPRDPAKLSGVSPETRERLHRLLSQAGLSTAGEHWYAGQSAALDLILPGRRCSRPMDTPYR